MKSNKKSVKDISLAQQILVIKYWGLWVGLEVAQKIGRGDQEFMLPRLGVYAPELGAYATRLGVYATFVSPRGSFEPNNRWAFGQFDSPPLAN